MIIGMEVIEKGVESPCQNPAAVYEEHTVDLEKGDLVIMMTDGVTEGRNEDGFIEREVIFELIERKKDEPA